jgi:hypothetical protein
LRRELERSPNESALLAMAADYNAACRSRFRGDLVIEGIAETRVVPSPAPGNLAAEVARLRRGIENRQIDNITASVAEARRSVRKAEKKRERKWLKKARRAAMFA